MSKAIQIISIGDKPLALHDDGTVWVWRERGGGWLSSEWHLLEHKRDNQIDPWKAIEFALEHIDDHYDRAEFLQSCTESDMVEIGVVWASFVAWCGNE